MNSFKKTLLANALLIIGLCVVSFVKSQPFYGLGWALYGFGMGVNAYELIRSLIIVRRSVKLLKSLNKKYYE
ncbi:hypothetical protein ACJVQT_22930 [Enterobacter huaxiensis]|uniref:hypothetical protein n=1 Tax=Enterobacter huaxiensis TaxID=2494702 RepID=UPI0021758D4A|nr:hypothetical protein [Enterobacter huaxiensis]MCS5452522.1 hypothetical protein [Enterobacter huaxiensis]